MSDTSRRAFAKSLVVVGTAAPLLLGQTPKPASAVGKALTEMVRANYGKHLSAEELERIDKDFQDYAPFVEKFREYKLVNSDEPDFTFGSLVERW
jgi:hypothetical protein